MLITIDGGSASGKSTLAREISERFEIPLLESGSLYRSLTLKALEAGVSFADSKQIESFVASLSLSMKLMNRHWILVVNGSEINPKKLRTVEVTEKVGLLSRVAGIRRRLIPLQRSCYKKGKGNYLIAEGRDMGSVVFPKADAIIFLKVSDEEMAKRRQKDFEAEGSDLSQKEVRKKEMERDRIDRERKASPLKVPKRAVVLDTTGKSIAESYSELIRLINIRKKRSNFLYWLCKKLEFTAKFHLRMKIAGSENIPAKGGFILAANHQSHLDPVVLGAASKRSLSYMARSTLFEDGPFFSWFIRQLNAYPVNRENPDRKILSQYNRFLLEGHGIVYFPEGTRTRTGKMGDFKKGVGALAVRTACPVIPVYISGTREAMPVGAAGVKKGDVRMRLGSPIDFTDLYGKKISPELYVKAAERVRDAITKLRAESQESRD